MVPNCKKQLICTNAIDTSLYVQKNKVEFLILPSMLLFNELKVCYVSYYYLKSLPTSIGREFSRLISCAVKVKNNILQSPGILQSQSFYGKFWFWPNVKYQYRKCCSFLRMALKYTSLNLPSTNTLALKKKTL